MIKNINYIFWGLFLVILDFNINRFDILPDFIGYILAAIGTGGLINSSNQFSTARISCWILFVLSIVGLFNLGQEQLTLVFGLIGLLLNCIMMWYLLGGFSNIALKINRTDLSNMALARRKLYIILSCAATITWLIAIEMRELASLAIVVIVISMLVLIILILHLIYQVKTAIKTNPNNLIQNPYHY